MDWSGPINHTGYADMSSAHQALFRDAYGDAVQASLTGDSAYGFPDTARLVGTTIAMRSPDGWVIGHISSTATIGFINDTIAYGRSSDPAGTGTYNPGYLHDKHEVWTKVIYPDGFPDFGKFVLVNTSGAQAIGTLYGVYVTRRPDMIVDSQVYGPQAGTYAAGQNVGVGSKLSGSSIILEAYYTWVPIVITGIGAGNSGVKFHDEFSNRNIADTVPTVPPGGGPWNNLPPGGTDTPVCSNVLYQDLNGNWVVGCPNPLDDGTPGGSTAIPRCPGRLSSPAPPAPVDCEQAPVSNLAAPGGTGGGTTTPGVWEVRVFVPNYGDGIYMQGPVQTVAVAADSAYIQFTRPSIAYTYPHGYLVKPPGAANYQPMGPTFGANPQITVTSIDPFTQQVRIAIEPPLAGLPDPRLGMSSVCFNNPPSGV